MMLGPDMIPHHPFGGIDSFTYGLGQPEHRLGGCVTGLPHYDGQSTSLVTSLITNLMPCSFVMVESTPNLSLKVRAPLFSCPFGVTAATKLTPQLSGDEFPPSLTLELLKLGVLCPPTGLTLTVPSAR